MQLDYLIKKETAGPLTTDLCRKKTAEAEHFNRHELKITKYIL